MNFNDAPERKISPFLNPGSNLVLTITSIELEKSKSSDGLRPVFFMESEPIKDPSFEGWQGAKAKIGKVAGNAGFYLKTDNHKQQFLGDLRNIAIALGKEEDLKNIPDGDFPELVKAASGILRGGFAKYFITGSEYAKANGKYGVRLTFPNKNFVTSLDGELEKFDRTNPKHYQPLPTQKAEPKDDLPF